MGFSHCSPSAEDFSRIPKVTIVSFIGLLLSHKHLSIIRLRLLAQRVQS